MNKNKSLPQVSENNKTIEDLENYRWPPPDFNSKLVTRCCSLRKVPIGQLEPDDIRVLISQNIGVKHLIHRAVEILRTNPAVQTKFYPGDLLLVVLKLSASFFDKNPDIYDEINKIAAEAIKAETSAGNAIFDEVVMKAARDFTKYT